jgi:hypothetical protein
MTAQNFFRRLLKSVWVESNRTLHTLHNGEEEYLWTGADDALELDEAIKNLAKRPSDDITKAEKLEVPVEDLIGWTILDTRIESQLLEWKRLLRIKEKKHAKYLNG